MAASEDKAKLIGKLKQALECVKVLESYMERRENIEKRKKNILWSLEPQAEARILLVIWFVAFLVIAFFFSIIADDEIGTCIAVPSSIVIVIVAKIKMGTSIDGTAERESKEIKEDLQNLDSEIRDYCNRVSYEKKIECVPKAYLDSESIAYIISCLENGRADTLKEALNLYEEYLHRMRMETAQSQQLEATEHLSNMMEQQVAQTQRQLSEMSRMSASMRSTARAAKLNAFLTIIK